MQEVSVGMSGRNGVAYGNRQFTGVCRGNQLYDVFGMYLYTITGGLTMRIVCYVGYTM